MSKLFFSFGSSIIVKSPFLLNINNPPQDSSESKQAVWTESKKSSSIGGFNPKNDTYFVRKYSET